MALIYAIDQGTSSTRVLVFKASDWQVISQHQLEFNSIYPDEGCCDLTFGTWVCWIEIMQIFAHKFMS